MAFNELLQIVGGFGRFQWIYITVLFIPSILIGCHRHRCRVPGVDDAFGGVNQSILLAYTNLTSNQSCTRITMDNNGTNVTTEPCRDGWVYDTSVLTSTIVTEWDLVCELRSLRQVAQLIYMAGVLVGSFLLGILSDRFGRRIILAISYLLTGVSGTCAAFLPNFVAYCIFRCVCGMAVSGVILNINALACHSILQNFTAALPAHRCRIPSMDNESVVYNLSSLAAFIPANESVAIRSCRRIRNGPWTNVTTEPCQDGWVYDKSVFTSTIVTEWDLVCDQRNMRQVAQSIFMAGVLVGAFILGNLSDRFGRRSVLSGCYLLLAVSGTCAAFLPSFVAYCIFRFLCGAAWAGIAMNTVSLALEWTPPKRRTTVGTIFAFAFTIGQLLLPGIAYGLRDWRWLQFAVSAPYFFFFLISCFLPESARWQLVKGRSVQALRDLKRVAQINGRKKEAQKLTEEVISGHIQSDLCGTKPSHSLLDLFRTPGMRQITVCVMLVWFATNFSFYGLSMDLFGFSIYLVQLIFGCIDIPAKGVGAFLMSHVGRRVTQAASLILAGVALICSAFLSQDMPTARMVAAVIGKACLSASFGCAYLYATELFPTVVRQSGMGVASMIARVGSISAPMVLLLSEISPIFPPAIYGVTAIISGSAAAFLLETGNQKLPDIIEDVEARLTSPDKYKFYLKEKVPLTQNYHLETSNAKCVISLKPSPEASVSV